MGWGSLVWYVVGYNFYLFFLKLQKYIRDPVHTAASFLHC